jgi:hypothetical protein
VSELKIAPVPIASLTHPLAAAASPGIYPYVGGSISGDELQSVVTAYGGAVVSGRQGAKLAATTPGVLVDPAAYTLPGKDDSEPLFDYDEWLIRQQAAGLPVILTDRPRIRNRDRSALRKALERWDDIDDPTLVVLPIEPWWLRDGLAWLTEEVKEAGRPVAIVLLHRYNGFDAAGTAGGLVGSFRASSRCRWSCCAVTSPLSAQSLTGDLPDSLAGRHIPVMDRYRCAGSNDLRAKSGTTPRRYLCRCCTTM